MQRLLFFILLLAANSANAQAPHYPKNYFRNPLNFPIELAGNFGECRPGHFHSGMDIKTKGTENHKVFAAADGYVSRIKMEPGGFGHGLYITHPNGFTSLYAHLNNFNPALQAFVRRQQYAKETWTLDLQLTPSQFPVKKGEFIAYSGNTGGSTAPHLHFEIRNTKTEHPLNPQLFGFTINDKLPPVLKQLAVYDLNKSVYQQDPKLLPIQGKAGRYTLKQTELVTEASLIGLGLVLDDYMNGSSNTLAYYTLEWYLDQQLQGSLRLDDIGYDQTRYVNAYADYRLKAEGKPWVQCLFRLRGNQLRHIYEDLNKDEGALRSDEDKAHTVRIVVRDAAGNKSELSFQLKFGKALPTAACEHPALPGKAWSYIGQNVKFDLSGKEVYDAICLPITEKLEPNSLSPIVTIASAAIPIHQRFELLLKPNKQIASTLANKIVLVQNDGKKEDGQLASPSGDGWFKASVRALGSYRLELDTTAPQLRPLQKIAGNLSTAKKIAFIAEDDRSSVKSFRGELDGKWLLFEQHGKTWTYVFDKHCPKGQHSLHIRISDENGNERESVYTFVR